ncbi:ATP synthase, F1 epsilon subunit [Synechococcus sp. PCC 7502]|uniref:ATP synthase F1 subunit epsilon n=1 Tax=Synechococcus sp. PCC 7502 TaxID=1173263 RepID=UPI00029F8B92|nr:ATP synthase F1 subunit epsilon [Synechococcus sp. PCC 7502]AFY73185.1 ATP synthase, F1 epsilon subunit [Synechococcus sp. PCC 7502]
MTLTVKVISPGEIILDATADEVILPSSTGQLGILTNHAPLTAVLDIGVLRFKTKNQWEAIAVMGGVAEVEENEVTVLVNSAITGSNVDVTKVRQELEAAEKHLASVKDDDKQGKIQAVQDVKRARAKLAASA